MPMGANWPPIPYIFNDATKQCATLPTSDQYCNQMKYYIYIDESGPFDESFSGVKASVVGGICSEHSAKHWDYLHRGHLEQFCREHSDVDFSYPGHYHCGPLLAGKIRGPMGSDSAVVGEFTNGVFQNVLSKATFGFLSRNVGKKFEYSPQATYVMNLIAALRNAFQLMSESHENIDSVHVVVAQRTIGETSKVGTVEQYMSFLLAHVTEQLLVGDGAGVALAKRIHALGQLDFSTGLGDQNAGLIAADFVCCLGRSGRKAVAGGSLHLCQPNQDALLGDYKAFHDRQAQVFLKNKYYGSCLEFLCKYFPSKDGQPDVEQLVGQLKRETDQQVLQRELPALLSVIHQLSKNRTKAPNMLAVAIRVAERLVELAKKYSVEINSNGIQRHWLNFHIQALAELSACYSHTGSVGPQQIAEEQLTVLLSKRGKDTGMDATQRQSLLIDVRNRNLNLLFNDYRFEDAYYLAEELSEARRQMVPEGEADELLGQILGSHGQSCAFMARSDSTWFESAIELFKQSLDHFASGSYQEDMSRNFLVTTAWQAGHLDDAVKYMIPAIGLDFTPEDAIGAISERLSLPSPEGRAFEVVNCLRIAAAYSQSADCQRLDIRLRNDLESIARRIGTDHPYEQWLKWLGILHLQCEEFPKAESCFVAAKAICTNHAFTMQTIGSSIALLQVVTNRIKSSGKASQTNEQQFHLELKNLRNQSASFDAYMRKSLVPETLASPRVDWYYDSKVLWNLYTFLPFAYA